MVLFTQILKDRSGARDFSGLFRHVIEIWNFTERASFAFNIFFFLMALDYITLVMF